MSEDGIEASRKRSLLACWKPFLTSSEQDNNIRIAQTSFVVAWIWMNKAACRLLFHES